MISERALIRRINRKLAHQGQVLHKARPAGYDRGAPVFTTDLGEFYVADNRTGALLAGHQDPYDLGASLKVA